MVITKEKLRRLILEELNTTYSLNINTLYTFYLYRIKSLKINKIISFQDFNSFIFSLYQIEQDYPVLLTNVILKYFDIIVIEFTKNNKRGIIYI